jgi:hypothetical protein
MRTDQITYAQQSRFLVEAIPLSDLSNIIVDHAQTAKLPFLTEPRHTWCYFYAKAELAYQKKDWRQVIDLVDEAISLGYRPEDPFEWLSYIEAQALIGNIDSAKEFSNTALARDNNIRKGLCEVWKRVQAQGPAPSEMEDRAYRVLIDFQCAP